MAQDRPEETRWRDAFRELMDQAPESFQSRYEQFAAMRDIFFEELAVRLERPLNKYLASQPGHLLNQTMADQLELQLSQIDLAPRCPRSGRRAKLVIDPADSQESGRGRFGLVVTDEAGQTFRTFSQRKLPELELMQNDPARSPRLTSRLRKSSPAWPNR